MIVVDASVAVKWAVEEPGRPEAMRLLALPEELAAPDLIFVELTNVLRRKAKSGQVTQEQARQALAAVEVTWSSVLPASSLWQDAMVIAGSLDHAAHDCFYLAAALDRGTLVTADERLARKCRDGGYGARVRSLDQLDDLAVASVADIPGDLLSEIARLSELIKQTFQVLREAAEARSTGTLKIVPARSFAPAFESPAYLKLGRALEVLPPEQLGDLVALGWLGRSYHVPGEWTDLKGRGRQMAAEGFVKHQAYFIAQMNLVAAGLEKLRSISPH